MGNKVTMLDELKNKVCRANIELAEEGLVFRTFGNVSGVDRDGAKMVIKPSGVPYKELTPDKMVVVSLDTGQVLSEGFKPSSDTPTHLEIYRAMEHIGAVAHTHSIYATAWSQACREIPPLGTTGADYFHGPVPCTRTMTDDEIGEDYEANTGKVIAERMSGLDPVEFPAILVANHGPFAWGLDPHGAVESAAIVEHLARIALETLNIDPHSPPISQALLDKHFLRKHGPQSYYGQT